MYTIYTQYETSFANSHEAITFRKILQDKQQVTVFLRYLEIKSAGRVSLARQDIDLWLEVQKYKVQLLTLSAYISQKDINTV